MPNLERNPPGPASDGTERHQPNFNGQSVTRRGRKFPPYGKILAERQKFKNLSFLVVVCIGQNAWPRAKQWNQSPNDIEGLVCPDELPPSQYRWPVQGCICIVDWDTGPSETLIIDLIQALIDSGAKSVTVRPLFADLSKPIWHYDTQKPVGERWIQVREVIRTYPNAMPGAGGVDHAA